MAQLSKTEWVIITALVLIFKGWSLDTVAPFAKRVVDECN